MKKVAVVVVLVCALGSAGVYAQDALDPAAEPNFGAFPLQAGFLPDPFIITVASGGQVDASTTGVGEGCVGFVTSQPDVVVDYTGAGEGLRFFVVGDGDTTLIVADPSGAYTCNDDNASGGVDPVVDIVGPADGSYSVWVGSYNTGEFVNGYLMLTEFSDSGPNSILTNIASFVTSFTEFDIAEPPETEATEEAAG